MRLREQMQQWLATFSEQQALEGPPEFHVENSVDNGIDARINVTKPSSVEEGVKTSLAALHIQLDTHRAQDVHREEWHPAGQKYP